MASKHPVSSEQEDEKATEAKHVAEDAVEAAEEGDMEEARFLAGEARALDPKAANQVLADTPIGKKG